MLSVYQQYLSAPDPGRPGAAMRCPAGGVAESRRRPGELSPAASARLSGAVWVALGQRALHLHRPDRREMAGAAGGRRPGGRPQPDRDLSLANQIMGHWRYRQTDECRRARAEIAKLLVAEVATARSRTGSGS